MRNIVILDSHYLCWRGFYTTGRLSYNGNATGVLYAFFRDIMAIQDLFNPSIVAFCFEGSGKRLREAYYPDYKKNRIKVLTNEEAQARDGLKMQINVLREDVLPNMGFKNVFAESGYEADDLIASICLENPDDDITIVSGDSDLYQLLTKRVRLYNPRDKSIMTKKKFKRTYGIKPSRWAEVKAITGDSSDNIKGVKGVGEVFAIRYLNEELGVKSVHRKRIEQSEHLINQNLQLIKLPFEDCPIPILETHDEVNLGAWSDMLERFGIKNLKPGGSGGKESKGFDI